MARRVRPLRSSVAAMALLLLEAPALIAACARVEPAAPPSQRAPLPPDVEQLQGYRASELAFRLGEPDFLREEPPALIWQYRSDDCVLDLFFYRSGDELVLAHAETRYREVIRAAQSDCYAEIVARRARRL